MWRGRDRTSPAGCTAPAVTARSRAGRSWTSTTAPSGRRFTIPLSTPSSATRASRRGADSHRRRVRTNARTGAAKKPIRKILVVASSGMPNVALRVRSHTLCGRASPITQRSKNGYTAIMLRNAAGRTTAGRRTFQLTVWPAISVLSRGMIRRAPSRKPTYQSGWDPVDTAAGWYGPYSQIGLTLRERGEQRQDGEREHEERRRLQQEPRIGGTPAHVRLRLGHARPLRVLQVPDDHQVRGHEGDQQPGDQQDVDREQAGEEDLTGEHAAEDEEDDVRAGYRDRLHDPLRDAQTGAGQQVVGERVVGDPLGEGERDQGDADLPVDLARRCSSQPHEGPVNLPEVRR